jgi:hypothetical protein
MKHFLYILIAAMALVACGTDSKHFKIDGRLLNINQGEFFLYSTDGALSGLDTIKVRAGRFTKEIVCDRPTTLMLVFPNFTEQPIFAEPGKTVNVEGDAYHLKRLTVKGTKDNKLMNAFRQQIENASPPEALKFAKQFIIDHPESMVSVWMVRRYFIATPSPDYATARSLIATMLKAQPDNIALRRLQGSVKTAAAVDAGDKLPRFTTRDINGRSVSDATLRQTPYAAVLAWASWSSESINLLRQMDFLQNELKGKFSVISICLDPDVATARRLMEQNKIDCTAICDGKMIDNAVYRALGMHSIPDNLLLHEGKVVGTNMTFADLSKEVRKH